jgi:hypothetical protein
MDKQTEAEMALGGNPVPGTNAGVVDAPQLGDVEVPPGFEGDSRSGGGPTEPLRYDVRLASRDEIQAGLGRPWSQTTRINAGKALIRLSVFDKGKDGKPELVGVATVRYAISSDGSVSGPFAFRDDSWSQYQAGHNAVVDKLAKMASGDADQGAYFRELCQRAQVSAFAQANQAAGSFMTLGGTISYDINAFCNKHREWIIRKVLSLNPPARRAPATIAPPVAAPKA